MAVFPARREATSARTLTTFASSSAMTASTRAVRSSLPKYSAILRRLLAVLSAPMKLTLNQGMPNLLSIISAM